jgi:hypothetical protein
VSRFAEQLAAALVCGGAAPASARDRDAFSGLWRAGAPRACLVRNRG